MENYQRSRHAGLEYAHNSSNKQEVERLGLETLSCNGNCFNFARYNILLSRMGDGLFDHSNAFAI
jgi:hypothetical protein